MAYSTIRSELLGIRDKGIPYSYVLALGCVLVFLGVTGVLFDRQLTGATSEVGSPSETPAKNETSPDGSPGRDLES